MVRVYTFAFPQPRVPRLEQVEQRMSLIDKAINNVTEEFLCPITRELLVDPVIATEKNNGTGAY